MHICRLIIGVADMGQGNLAGQTPMVIYFYRFLRQDGLLYDKVNPFYGKFESLAQIEQDVYSVIIFVKGKGDSQGLYRPSKRF